MTRRMAVELGEFSLDRVVRAVEKVRERLLRASDALERGGVPYAVAGGNAVALWVSRVDEAAVRNTRDVDILIRRQDLDAARSALEAAGFVYRHSSGIDLFLDGPDAKARDAVHLVFAGETVRAHESQPNPDVTDSENAGQYRVLSLPALVRVKLTAYRDKDRTHLRDLIDVGLVDESWCERLPAELADRLHGLLESPEG
ncbi:MAG: nucleotidyltransferase family protein [Isosphaeraceae bacterium]